MLPRTALEQWAVLKAVVEEGGFAQAAATLHRSQSSISYAVANLQQALGIALLEPQGRRAVLTPAGRTLLGEVSPLLEELVELETRAHNMAAGGIASLHLLVDNLFPKERLFRALRGFAERYPHVAVRLREIVRQTLYDVKDEDFDLALAVADFKTRHREHVADIELVAVAAASHPLSRSEQPLHSAALARYPRVEISGLGGSELLESAPTTIWEMTTTDAAVEAVRQGLCYGWLPKDRLGADLTAGRLKMLPLEIGSSRFIPLALSLGRKTGSDPAVLFMAELLSAEYRA